MAANCFSRSRILFLLTALVLLGGCLGRSQATRFYLLHATPGLETAAMAPASENLRIGIGPVTLPDYLDRPQIVTRISESGLLIDEFNQWGEHLTSSTSRVLAENLSTLLSTEYIFTFPWPGSTPIDYQVKVDVTDFKGALGGSAALAAQYTILDEKKEIIGINSVAFNRTPGNPGYEALVSCMSRMLEDLSGDIAAKIMALPKGNGKAE